MNWQQCSRELLAKRSCDPADKVSLEKSLLLSLGRGIKNAKLAVVWLLQIILRWNYFFPGFLGKHFLMVHFHQFWERSWLVFILLVILSSFCCQPLNSDQYNSIRKLASEIHSYAPDARVLTTYYCGEAFCLPLHSWRVFFLPQYYLR